MQGMWMDEELLVMSKSIEERPAMVNEPREAMS